jgi:hypothetical protein
MSENDEQDGKLRLPWGNIEDAIRQQKEAARKGRVVEFFESLVLPETSFDFVKFQSNWHRLDQYDFSGHDLTIIFSSTAAALAEMKNTQLKKDCLSEVMFRFSIWEKQAVEKIYDFGQQDLAQCMWSYRMLGLNPSDEFLNQWYQYADYTKVLLDEQQDHKFVRSIVSIAVANMKPTKSFMDAWLPRAIKALPEFTPAQLTFSLWAYARLAIEPETEFMMPWLARYDELLAQKPLPFKQRDLANILGSCDALHAITGKEQFRSIASRANNLINLSECTKPELRQIGYARLWFDWPHDEEIPFGDDNPSFEEKKLLRAFNDAGFSPATKKVRIEDLNTSPDMVFEHKDRTILLEVDGKPHFLFEINEFNGRKQPAGFTGRTLFMSALLHKFVANATILRMPYPLINQIMGQHQQLRNLILGSILDQAAEVPPGAYHARLNHPLRQSDRMKEPPGLYPLKLASFN